MLSVDGTAVIAMWLSTGMRATGMACKLVCVWVFQYPLLFIMVNEEMSCKTGSMRINLAWGSITSPGTYQPGKPDGKANHRLHSKHAVSQGLRTKWKECLTVWLALLPDWSCSTPSLGPLPPDSSHSVFSPFSPALSSETAAREPVSAFLRIPPNSFQVFASYVVMLCSTSLAVLILQTPRLLLSVPRLQVSSVADWEATLMMQWHSNHILPKMISHAHSIAYS